MPKQVVAGAVLKCTCGTITPALLVPPKNRVSAPTPAANIMDHLPVANIPTFGNCTTTQFPATKTATTAAKVLTPMPCVPSTALLPWLPGATTVLIGGLPALDNTCKLACSWSGIITIVSPGQTQTDIP